MSDEHPEVVWPKDDETTPQLDQFALAAQKFGQLHRLVDLQTAEAAPAVTDEPVAVPSSSNHFARLAEASRLREAFDARHREVGRHSSTGRFAIVGPPFAQEERDRALHVATWVDEQMLEIHGGKVLEAYDRQIRYHLKACATWERVAKSHMRTCALYLRSRPTQRTEVMRQGCAERAMEEGQNATAAYARLRTHSNELATVREHRASVKARLLREAYSG
jgi:hypothetical protein